MHAQQIAVRPLLSLPSHQPPPPRDPPRRSAWVRVVYLVPLAFIFSLLAFAAYTFLYTLCYVSLPPPPLSTKSHRTAPTLTLTVRRRGGGAPPEKLYLGRARNRPVRALCYALAFLPLDLGCSAHFAMAYLRGTAGFVPRPDPEADIAVAPTSSSSAAANHLASFVRTLPASNNNNNTDDDDDDTDADSLLEDEEQEHAALLDRTAPLPPRESGRARPAAAAALGPNSSARTRTRTPTRRALQVKSDGSARFCRKVSSLSLSRVLTLLSLAH